jgi:hypothetical protein
MAKRPLINPGFMPSVGPVPTEEGTAPREKLWSFSFRFWRQMDHFGFEGAGLNAGWFVSLLDQLKSLSQETVEDIRRGGDSRKAKVLRYHEINWSQPNIPIKRQDFDWLPEDFLDNEAEFPFFQFQISTGKGRIVGFWDDAEIFNVLLLDPRHNLQPSKDFNYRVDPCAPMRNQFEELEHVLQVFHAEAEKGCATHPECLARTRLRELRGDSSGSLVITVSQEQWQDVSGLIKAGTIESIDDLFAFAVLMAEEQPNKLRELAGH